jgi:hypothetical protein
MTGLTTCHLLNLLQITKLIKVQASPHFLLTMALTLALELSLLAPAY